MRSGATKLRVTDTNARLTVRSIPPDGARGRLQLTIRSDTRYDTFEGVLRIGRVNGRLLRDALRRAALRRGATILHGSAAVVRDRARVSGVRVGGETITAGAVIIAGGAWSNALGASLGVTLPIYPLRGQILHLDVPGTTTTNWSVILGFHSHYLLAFPQHRIVAGATREHDAGYDYRRTAGGVREALGEALRLAPGLWRSTSWQISTYVGQTLASDLGSSHDERHWLGTGR